MRNWRTTFERYCAVINGKALADITALLLAAADKPSVHVKLRQRIAAVLEWAKFHDHVDENVTDGIEHALPKMSKTNGHHAACAWQDAKAELVRVIEAESSVMRLLAFEFTLLTACRTNEVRQAEWSEIDFDAKVWTIPTERTKMKTAHRVPLSDEAMKCLRSAKRQGVESACIFANPKTGKALGSAWATEVGCRLDCSRLALDILRLGH